MKTVSTFGFAILGALIILGAYFLNKKTNNYNAIVLSKKFVKQHKEIRYNVMRLSNKYSSHFVTVTVPNTWYIEVKDTLSNEINKVVVDSVCFDTTAIGSIINVKK